MLGLCISPLAGVVMLSQIARRVSSGFTASGDGGTLHGQRSSATYSSTKDWLARNRLHCLNPANPAATGFVHPYDVGTAVNGLSRYTTQNPPAHTPKPHPVHLQP